jgi:hypothetical protein
LRRRSASTPIVRDALDKLKAGKSLGQLVTSAQEGAAEVLYGLILVGLNREVGPARLGLEPGIGVDDAQGVAVGVVGPGPATPRRRSRPSTSCAANATTTSSATTMPG